MDDCRGYGFMLARSMSNSEVRMTPRPPKTPAWSIAPLMSSPIDDPSSSDNASDNSDKIESICQSTQSRNRKRKIIGTTGASFINSNTGLDHHHVKEQMSHGNQNNQQGGSQSLWAEAESLAADFDGSLSGLGADLSTSSYDMSEALLALPSLGYHHRNTSSQQTNNNNPASGPGFLKEAGLTPLAAAHLHGGSSVSLPGDFQFENHSSPNSACQQQHSATGCQTHPTQDSMHLDCERRFQYVLAAATSVATKVNEETLTYLNQNQPYEIKLKKLGELTAYRGVVFRSVVRLCFHDRRLQFSEREQLALWEDAHPNDRILQVDLPLSYGVTLLPLQPDAPTNTISLLWEPLKEVGLYIKINCISTEFTPKKHGGEKGVPFRMLIETYSHPDNVRLHAGACQVKVFKLKGADRKHKQDREKICKKTPGEQAKLQPSYECTVLSDISLESLDSPPPSQNASHNQHTLLSPSYSTEHPNHPDSPEHSSSNNSGNGSALVNGVSHAVNPGPPCGTNNSPNCNSNYVNCFSPHFSPESVRRWLIRNRFASTKTLWDFSGLDLLRLSKEELIEMCGLAEGIRLYNALHYKITFYVTLVASLHELHTKHEQEVVVVSRNSANGEMGNMDHNHHPEVLYHPMCLSSPSIAELTSVLGSLFHNQFPNDSLPVERLLLSVHAPGNSRIRVLLTEQLLSTLKDQTAFKAAKSGAEVFLEVVE